MANIYDERIVIWGNVWPVTMEQLVGAVSEIRLLNVMPEHGNIELTLATVKMRAQRHQQKYQGISTWGCIVWHDYMQD